MFTFHLYYRIPKYDQTTKHKWSRISLTELTEGKIILYCHVILHSYQFGS